MRIAAKMNHYKLGQLFNEKINTTNLFWSLMGTISHKKANEFMAYTLAQEFSFKEIRAMFDEYPEDYFYTE